MDGTDLDWAAVRRAYEAGGESLRTLAARFGVGHATISRRAAREGWESRPRRTAATGRTARRAGTAPPDPEALIRSLQRTTARLVTALEARLDAGPADEKDVRVLGALAGTLTKVIALATPERPARDDDAGSDPGDDGRPPDPTGGGGRAAARGRGAGRADGRFDLDFDDPAVLDALSRRLERLAADRAGGVPASPVADRTGDLGEILDDLRASRPAGAGR